MRLVNDFPSALFYEIWPYPVNIILRYLKALEKGVWAGKRPSYRAGPRAVGALTLDFAPQGTHGWRNLSFAGSLHEEDYP